MPDPNLLRSRPDTVAKKLARRGFKPDIDELDTLEERHKVPQAKTESLQTECNSRLKSIGQTKACGEGIEPLRPEMDKLSEELDAAKTELNILRARIRGITLAIPNPPTSEVSVGRGENDNVEANRWGTPREFDLGVHDHVTLSEMHSGLDFAAAVKLTDSRFVVTKGQIVRVYRALSQFILGLYTEQHDCNENYVPYPVNQDTLCDTGQLPKSVGGLFYIRPLEGEADTSNYVLVPMVEVPPINLVRGEIIDEDDLPTKMTTHIPCFRSEAGPYGHDIRGLIRMHQFDKVEMMQIMCPEDSMAALEEMIGHAGKVLQLLDPPYHKTTLYTDDMGFDTCKTYDLEVWIPAQSTYRGISSCSNVWDFQARHMQARYRSESNRKIHLARILSGSGLTIGRTLVTVMESYQQTDDRTEVPEILCPYMNKLECTG